MNQQKCKVKKGQSYWSIMVDDGKYEWQEHVVRSIQNRKQYRPFGMNLRVAYFTQKLNGTTWVKKSKKNGDWGWDKNIHPVFKNKSVVASDGSCKLPFSVYTTKLQAAKFWMGILKENLKRKDLYPGEREEDLEDLKCVKRAISRLQNNGGGK